MTRMVCVNWLVVCVFYMVGVHSSKEIKHGSFIRGTYHAWWIILGVDQHSAVKMLNGMSLVNLINIIPFTCAPFFPLICRSVGNLRTLHYGSHISEPMIMSIENGDYVRDRPFNLKEGVMVFCFVYKFFFGQHESQNIYFFCRAKRNFFPESHIRLYDKNSESFFPPPKSEYFFQKHWESEYFFRKKP